MTVQYQILTKVKDRIALVSGIKYVGFYPDDYKNVVITNMPACLVQNGNSTTQFHAGRRNNNRMYISVMLYSDYSVSRLEQVLQLQNDVIEAVIADIHYDSIVSNIFGYSVQVGDITDFLTPSTSGMNGNMTVRKITFDFEYWTQGIS